MHKVLNSLWRQAHAPACHAQLLLQAAVFSCTRHSQLEDWIHAYTAKQAARGYQRKGECTTTCNCTLLWPTSQEKALLLLSLLPIELSPACSSHPNSAPDTIALPKLCHRDGIPAEVVRVPLPFPPSQRHRADPSWQAVSRLHLPGPLARPSPAPCPSPSHAQ